MLSLATRIFGLGSNPVRHKGLQLRPTGERPGMEALEKRDLMAMAVDPSGNTQTNTGGSGGLPPSPPAYITLNNGVVSIDGLARATYAEVTLDTGIPFWSGDDKYKVSLSDRATGQLLAEKAFSVGSISRVVYNGGDGDDHFENLTNLASTAYGGGGNDFLVGGGGNDYLYGGDGNDVLIGGSGDDSLSGGPGYDLIDGGSGRDLVRYNLGESGDYEQNIELAQIMQA